MAAGAAAAATVAAVWRSISPLQSSPSTAISKFFRRYFSSSDNCPPKPPSPVSALPSAEGRMLRRVLHSEPAGLAAADGQESAALEQDERGRHICCVIGLSTADGVG